jgi:hypothetical protein
MLTRIKSVLCTLVVCVGASTGRAQTSVTELQNILREKAAFAETDFAALQSSQPVVRLSPTTDKREVAVTGLINIHASADEFLQSYRDNMLRQSNAAILEIGSFAHHPTLSDLDGLTLEPRDIEDLKECVAGDCALKLSAAMIERFRKEIDWNAQGYQLAVTNLFKQILVEYVTDYRARGEKALIQYNDKQDVVSVATEQRALSSGSGYVNDLLTSSKASLQTIEDALVWSKLKFGLKPVIAINHITIYKRNNDLGPQVLIASKQIYANHYFNGSLGLTAFVNVADAANGAYLVYENRSRADGLEGPFGKLKRAMVEKKALEGLRRILEDSKIGLEGSVFAAATTDLSSYDSTSWGHRLFGGIRPLLWLLVLSALIALLVLGRRRVDSSTTSKSKALKPESAKS